MKHPRSYDSDDVTRKRMSRVKLKGGNAETIVAKELWKIGFRYWKNYKKLPGSPDIAIKKYKIAIFIDGEFWHGRDWEQKKTKLKRNREYWIEKIEENINRDRRVDAEIKGKGWIPVHFWTKEIEKDIEVCIKTIVELAFDEMIQQNID